MGRQGEPEGEDPVLPCLTLERNSRNGLCRRTIETWMVDRCKPILGQNAFDNVPARQHLEQELVQSLVQDSPIQDWSVTTFLGYDEVRAVKPLPHLGWRVSMCVPWDLNPRPFALLTQMLYHWATGTQACKVFRKHLTIPLIHPHLTLTIINQKY